MTSATPSLRISASSGQCVEIGTSTRVLTLADASNSLQGSSTLQRSNRSIFLIVRTAVSGDHTPLGSTPISISGPTSLLIASTVETSMDGAKMPTLPSSLVNPCSRMLSLQYDAILSGLDSPPVLPFLYR